MAITAAQMITIRQKMNAEFNRRANPIAGGLSNCVPDNYTTNPASDGLILAS